MATALIIALACTSTGRAALATTCEQDRTKGEAHLLVMAALDARTRTTAARFNYSVDWHRPDGAGPYGNGLSDYYECRIGSDAAVMRRQRNGPILNSAKLPAAMKGKAPDLSDPRVVAQLRQIGALIDRPVTESVLFRDGEATRYIEGEAMRVFTAGPFAADDQYLDPRWLGMTCDGEDIGLGRSNPTPFPVTEDWIEVEDVQKPAGVRVVERRFTIGGDAISDRLWIDTARGLNVIRREMRGESGDFSSIVKSTLKRWPGGVWFPARVERGVILRDGRSRASVIDITAAEFGYDFAASDLDLSALGAPPKTSVFDTRINGFVGHWDGTRIVPRREDEALQPMTAAAAAPPWGWITAAGLVALTAFFVRRRRASLTAPP